MKKLLLLTKTLLAVALLCVGQNAWAEVTPFSESYSSTSATTGWSSSTGGRFTPTILNESDNYFLSVTQSERNNNGATVTGNILSGKAKAGDDYTLIFDMRIRSHSDGNKGSAVLSIKDAAGSGYILRMADGGSNSTSWNVNETSTNVTLPGSNANSIDGITWCTYKISRSGVYTYLTITNKSTGADILARTSIGGASATGGLGNIVFETSRYNANFAIDNIVLRAIEDGDVPVATPTSYTIHFKNESSTTIKDDVVINTLVGSTVNADDYLTSIYTGGKKYIYKSGNTPIEAVEDAASNVITLVFREADMWTYTINAVDDKEAVIKEVVSGTQFEGDNKTAYFTKAFKKDDVWYQTTSGASGATYYGFDISSAAPTKSVLYTETDGIDYFFECEDMAVVNKRDNGSSAERGSNGAGVRLSNNGYIYTTALAAGTYTLRLNCNNPNSGTPTFDIKLWDGEKLIETGKTITKTVASTAYFAEETTIGIVVPEGMGLAICNFTGWNANPTFDYIILKRTGDATVSATIGAKGWATFSSDYALDFTGISDFEAYMITGHDGTVVTKSQVTGTVPAGTGLLLKGDAGNYTIPVVASSSTDVSANKLVAGTGESVSAEGGKTKYVLGVSGSDEAEFQKIVSTAATVAKGKAYLQFNEEILARTMSFVGDITGVETVEAVSEAKAKEGKFIENGKLVIVKNGVKFNAAGAKLY